MLVHKEPDGVAIVCHRWKDFVDMYISQIGLKSNHHSWAYALALQILPSGNKMDGSKLMNSIIGVYLKADEASEDAIRVIVENGIAIGITNVLSQLFYWESSDDLECNIGTVSNMKVVESAYIDDDPVVSLDTLVDMVG